MIKHTFVFHIIGLAKKIHKVIGFRLHLEPGSVVSLIDKLEKINLVKRESPDGDRRKYHIILTNIGKRKLRQIKSRAYQLDNALRNKLSEKEITSFFSTLEKIMAYLDDWKGGENEIPSTKRNLAP